MFCAPLVAAIPAYATAPALILVGALWWLRAQLVTEIAANIRSIEAGGGLLQEIDKAMGY